MDERPYSPFESNPDDADRRRDETEYEGTSDVDETGSAFGYSAGPVGGEDVDEPPLPDLPPVDPERNPYAFSEEDEPEEGSTWRQDLARNRSEESTSPYDTEYHVAGAQEGFGDDETRMEANLELERSAATSEPDYLTAPSAAGGVLGEGSEYVETSFDPESDSNFAVERNERRLEETTYGAPPPPVYGRVDLNDESREPEGLLEPHYPPLALPHEPLGDAHLRRDGETLLALGGFMTVLSIPVLIGTAFAVREHAMIVNAVAGGVLLLAGLGFLFRGWWTLRKAP